MTEAMALSVLNPDFEEYTAAERAALRFANAFAGDHYSIDDSYFAELRMHFTTKQIVQIGMLCAAVMGSSRFVVTFGVFVGSCPIPHEPGAQLVPAAEPVSAGARRSRREENLDP